MILRFLVVYKICCFYSFNGVIFQKCFIKFQKMLFRIPMFLAQNLLKLLKKLNSRGIFLTNMYKCIIPRIDKKNIAAKIIFWLPDNLSFPPFTFSFSQFLVWHFDKSLVLISFYSKYHLQNICYRKKGVFS